MIERIEAILEKYESLEKSLSDPEILKDLKKTKEKSIQ